jgi:hypothetical protein
MTSNTIKASILAALACALAAPAANADIIYNVDAKFTDGGTVTGYFDINASGYLGDFNLQTSANGPFAGFDFVPGNGNISGGSSPGSSKAVFFGPTYDGDQLVLYAKSPLDSAGPNSLTGASFECQNSYSCPTGGDVRFLAVPEPAVWAMMLIGVAGIGARLRRKAAMAAMAAI